MKQKNITLFAKLALLTATIIWGSSFIIVKTVVDDFPTYTLLAIRFLSASVILALIFIKSFKKITWEYVLQGAFLGILLYSAYALQTLGIEQTTPGKNAFLTAVYCVLVPFLAWYFTKKRPDRFNIIAAVLCIAGIGLISLTNDFTIGAGDLLTLAGGVFYALHIIAVSRFSNGKDVMLLTIFQFISAGVCAAVFSVIFDLGRLGSIAITTNIVLCIAYLAVFCTAGALTLQNFGQKYTDPSSASIILSLESVFGAAFSVAMGRETLDFKTAMGFVLIFIAVMVSETKLSFIFSKKKAI